MTLVDLPIGAKISPTLDYQTSPNNLLFMTMMRYYINQNQKYKEVLLGFESLIRAHIGKYLVTVFIQVLEHHLITNQVFSLTIDNASNNTTLATALEDTIPV